MQWHGGCSHRIDVKIQKYGTVAQMIIDQAIHGKEAQSHVVAAEQMVGAKRNALLFGGLIMVTLRVLTIFIFTAMLTGCMIEDLKTDVKALKYDTKAFKAYLRAIPPPSECQPPGTAQARICYYKLKVVSFDKDRGLFKGYVSPSVVKAGEESCTKSMQEIKDAGFPEVQDYTCRKAKHYMYSWYGFKIDGAIPDLNSEHGFINIPHTEYLRLGKPEEALAKSDEAM